MYLILCSGSIIQVYVLTVTLATKVCEDFCGVGIDCLRNNVDKFGDPVDCTKYYECWNFNLYHNDCPAGLVFDCERKLCDWDWASTCQPPCPEAGKIICISKPSI